MDDAVIALQDGHGQCVAYLLWAAWAAAEGRVPGPDALAAAAALAARWEVVSTGPLRQARRGLKAALPPIEDGVREALREQVRAAEFASERVLMEALERLAPEGQGPARPIAQALADAAAAWPAPASRQALDDLAARLD